MDLRLLSAEPSDAEREAIDAAVGGAARNGDRVGRADRHSRHLLLPALRAAQRRVGYVSEGALGYASRRLDVPPADAYGVADGGRVRVVSRRGSVEAPVRYDSNLRPGLAFMNLHFPDEVATNVLTIDATDPKSGTAEFKATAIRVEAV